MLQFERSRSQSAQDKGQQHPRVLVVEDQLLNQRIARTFLEKSGYQVDCACDGLEAVRIWRDAPNSYDAILMDIQMPVLDGFQATRWIRRLEGGSARPIPIIAYSARAWKSDRDLCLSAGMNDFVPKATEPQLLYEALRRVMST